MSHTIEILWPLVLASLLTIAATLETDPSTHSGTADSGTSATGTSDITSTSSSGTSPTDTSASGTAAGDTSSSTIATTADVSALREEFMKSLSNFLQSLGINPQIVFTNTDPNFLNRLEKEYEAIIASTSTQITAENGAKPTADGKTGDEKTAASSAPATQPAVARTVIDMPMLPCGQNQARDMFGNCRDVY